MGTTPLFLSRDVDDDWLEAVAVGRVIDGQADEHFRFVGERFRWLVEDGELAGFSVVELAEFDPRAPEHEELWIGPRFAVPTLALSAATAGEIVLAAKAAYGNESTIDRLYFDLAVDAEGEEALALWKCALETGDQKAHFALGYTLVELGRPREAYKHLRHYAELVPDNAWAWCWLGRACADAGRREEARHAFERAIERERAGSFETDAPELLAALDAG